MKKENKEGNKMEITSERFMEILKDTMTDSDIDSLMEAAKKDIVTEKVNAYLKENGL